MAHLAHIEKARFEAIFHGLASPHLEPPVSTIKAKVHPILAAAEIGIEGELTSIRDEITDVPKAKGILAG